MRHQGLEICPSTRTASAEATIGRGLKSLYSDVLSEPLPPSIAGALAKLQALAAEHAAEPKPPRAAAFEPETRPDAS